MDVNWYAYNGETIAERDRATVALQKRPFDPTGRAHGWGKIGVKIVISWLCCRATDLLDPLLSHGEFVCFPFLSNQLEMIGWGAKRMRDDWFKNQRRRDGIFMVDLIQLRKGNYFNHVFIRFIRYRRLDDIFLFFFFKRVNVAVIFIYYESFWLPLCELLQFFIIYLSLFRTSEYLLISSSFFPSLNLDPRNSLCLH